MSYQANFASHHTRDHRVGFLFARPNIGKQNKMFRNSLFRSDHNIKLQLSDKNINPTLGWNFKSCYEVYWLVTVYFVVFLCATPYKKETKDLSKIMHI